jgi:hypothetical protein
MFGVSGLIVAGKKRIQSGQDHICRLALSANQPIVPSNFFSATPVQA